MKCYNTDQKTAYKEAVANALSSEYADYSYSEEEWRKEYEQTLGAILANRKRGGVSAKVNQESWLAKMDDVAAQVSQASQNLWDAHHFQVLND